MSSSKRELWRLATLAYILLVSAASDGGDVDDPIVSPEDKRFDSIVSLLAEPAGLHGEVRKRGMVSMHTWSMMLRSQRHKDYKDWVLRQILRRPGVPRQPPLPYNCEVFVNHRYKFAYIRHPKTGSSAIFQRTLGGVCGKGSNKLTCMEKLKGAGWDLARRIWSQYYIFTFVRNPWARASSARDFLNWMNRQQRVNATSPDDACAYPRFTEYCQNPLLAAHKCMQNVKCCRYGPAFEWHHLQSQARCMFTSEGAIAVDFIGRSERSNEDFQQLVDILNKRRDPRLPPIEAPQQLSWDNALGGKTPGLGLETHARDYLGSPSCLESISQHWWQDVQWLGFPRVSSASIGGSAPIAWHRPAVGKKPKR